MWVGWFVNRFRLGAICGGGLHFPVGGSSGCGIWIYGNSAKQDVQAHCLLDVASERYLALGTVPVQLARLCLLHGCARQQLMLRTG